jgi:hypothetical protein
MKPDSRRTIRANHKHQIVPWANRSKNQPNRLTHPASGAIANYRRPDPAPNHKPTARTTPPICRHSQRKKHSVIATPLATHPLKLFWPSQPKSTFHGFCRRSYPQRALAMPAANGPPLIAHGQLPAPTLAATAQHRPPIFGSHPRQEAVLAAARNSFWLPGSLRHSRYIFLETRLNVFHQAFSGIQQS